MARVRKRACSIDGASGSWSIPTRGAFANKEVYSFFVDCWRRNAGGRDSGPLDLYEVRQPRLGKYYVYKYPKGKKKAVDTGKRYSNRTALMSALRDGKV